MLSKIIIFTFIFHICLILVIRPSKAQTWIRAGYYSPAEKEFPSSDINSALFTHLLCGFAALNSSSHELFIAPPDEEYFSSFTKTVKQKNPLVTTLASIGGRGVNYSTFSSMLNNPSYRRIFIDSSIKLARHYGFQGLDLQLYAADDMYNLGVLFKEWRAAINLEVRSSNQSQLILIAAVWYSPNSFNRTYPIDSIQYLNWIHIDFYLPFLNTRTSAPYALYNPTNVLNVNSAIEAWIDAGVPASKLVMYLPYFGYAWALNNSKENGIGAPASGPALQQGGSTYYAEIKNHIKQNGAQVMFNSTYVVNYCKIGTAWVAFDDVEAIRMKVSYAKEKGLLGYVVWQVSYDYDWKLSQTAAEQEDNTSGRNKRRLLIVISSSFAAVFLLLLGFVIYYCWMRVLKLKESRMDENNAAAAGDFHSNDPNLIAYSLADIEVATNGFSIENKLGEGGYGPVYKGILLDGLEVAVKKLSRTSIQGFEEFKNEVILTAKLQHVNLVKLLGFCIDRKEHILIYEYMPNKSLDAYLFDPIQKYILNWEKRVHIIESISQGLLYLQEYSRLTIIHRDLKASNILLDEDMRAKISDFGMARIFTEDSLEANTERIVGTYGYAPPEYVKRGIYSTKSDVYSFGVLLLQMISGKRVSALYGENDDLSLLEYAYDLWKDGKGMEFMEPALNDTYSSCKLMGCLQIALLCVQEVPRERPSMSEVFTMLQNESMVIMLPKKPAFSKQTNEGVQYESTTANLEKCSINDTTLSSLEAR